MTLSSTSTSVRRSTTLNPEETDLWELCYYAGVTIDPQVFRILFDLLNMDVHPKAVLDVLKSIAPHSKYSKKAGTEKRDTVALKTDPTAPLKQSKSQLRISKSKTGSKSRVSATSNQPQVSSKNSNSSRDKQSVKTAGDSSKSKTIDKLSNKSHASS